MPVDEKKEEIVSQPNFPYAVTAGGGRKINPDIKEGYNVASNDLAYLAYQTLGYLRGANQPICTGYVCKLDDYKSWGESYRNFIESKLKYKYNRTREQLEKGLALKNNNLEAILKEIEDYINNQYEPIMSKYENFEKNKTLYQVASYADYASPALGAGALALTSYFKLPVASKILKSVYKKLTPTGELAGAGLVSYFSYEAVDDAFPSVDWGSLVEEIVTAFQNAARLLDKFNQVDIKENPKSEVTTTPTSSEIADKKSGDNTNIYLGLAVGSVIALGTLYYMNKN